MYMALAEFVGKLLTQLAYPPICIGFPYTMSLHLFQAFEDQKKEKKNKHLHLNIYTDMDRIYSSFLLLALALLFISMEASYAQGQGQGKRNSKKAAPHDAASTHYEVLKPTKKGHERVFCQARGACNGKTLTCPAQCPERKPKMSRKKKGCFIDCSSKCEVTCKCKFLT